jgi:CRP-like cAMP-binding protein
MLAAMRQVPRVLATPPSDVLLQEFGGSAIVYRARFWLRDYSHDEEVKNDVRAAIYYEFRRRQIEIPWPILVKYDRHEVAQDTPERRQEFARAIGASSAMAGLDEATHQALAAAAVERLYASGEVIVREGESGESMFLIRKGHVVITVGPDAREVATTDAGGHFGEMSLLTGDPRSATVTARGDVTVLEISANTFGAYVRSHPEVIDRLAALAASRRQELDASKAIRTSAAVEPLTLAQRIKRFFDSAVLTSGHQPS